MSLVVAPNPKGIKDDVSRLCSDLVYENRFDFFISPPCRVPDPAPTCWEAMVGGLLCTAATIRFRGGAFSGSSPGAAASLAGWRGTARQQQSDAEDRDR